MQSLVTCNMLCSSIQLWPKPTGSVSLSTVAVPCRSDLFQLKVLQAPSTAVYGYLRDSFTLFKDDLRRMEPTVRGYEDWRSIVIRLVINGSADPRMRVDTDESYRLSLKPLAGAGNYLSVDIAARSFCGARHALETLVQMIWLDPYAGSLFILEAAMIEDKPRFSYRGLLLDTARNFFPVTEILRLVDGMGMNKFNTLHWHMTDSKSFPMRFAVMPQLSDFGSYGPGAVYTPDDVRAVVRHARLRGIRVLIEIDAPAHVGYAWSFGPSENLGDLAFCYDEENWAAMCNEPPCGQLNPENEEVYAILEQLYSDIIQITGVNDIFHIGGDDISESCWSRHLVNRSTTSEVWAHYMNQVLYRLKLVNQNILPNLTIMWVSHLSERIKTDLKEYYPNIGLQIRGGGWSSGGVEGVRSIYSREDAWDLNDGLGDWYENARPSYNSWQEMYEHRPWGKGSQYAVGGEATIWSTRLGPELEARVWPRAAAVAERLWADRPEGATRPVHARLDVQRARMMARGVQATPVWSMWCTHHPYTCI